MDINSVIHDDASLRYFKDRRGKEGRDSLRNPITQVGISDREIGMPSDGNPRGVAKGKFSEKSQGSFKLAYADKICPSTKKVNPNFDASRNPITQEAVPIAVQRSEAKFHRFTNSSIFENKIEEAKPVRSRGYGLIRYDKLQRSSVFTNEGREESYKGIKKVEYKAPEVQSLFCHNEAVRLGNVAVKPNQVRISSSDIQSSRKEAIGMAQIYNARRNNSAIFF